MGVHRLSKSRTPSEGFKRSGNVRALLLDMRALVIDDDQELLHVLAEALSAANVEVHCASESEEAAALFHHVQYEVIITDLSLTAFGYEGLQLLKSIAALRPRPYTIVLTGDANPVIRETALRNGAHLFLSKPIPIDRLCSLTCQGARQV